jgi:hypothetical protein
MKRRTQPHVSVQGSYAEDDYNYVNTEYQDPNFGLIRFRGQGWYQKRRCPNGLIFEIRHLGPIGQWLWLDWSKVECRLDELIQTVLFQQIPNPWENPDALNCDLLYFSDFTFKSPGQFEFGFLGQYSTDYHEYLEANFEGYELRSIEWIT